jgi:hypothetical protein
MIIKEAKGVTNATVVTKAIMTSMDTVVTMMYKVSAVTM